MKLQQLDAQSYAREVLPQTAGLWANGKDLESYVAQWAEIAESPYGKRHFRTMGFFDGNALVASFKRYERAIQFGNARLRAFGIGAVFTPPASRGRGYASAMLAMMLDESRRAGADLAYLFSDIHPQFYKGIGFVELPSRSISIRADALDNGRIGVEVLAERDWTAVRKCFDALASGSSWSFERSPIVWDWIRLGMRYAHVDGQPAHLILRRGRSVVAYVLGQREPAHDCYVVDEFGYADDAAAAEIPRLLRGAAGDLRRITGWLPPQRARELLPRGSVRKRTGAILMAAALSPKGDALVEQARVPSPSDPVWSTDHV
ncbi:MAG: GNAT family N-acetyltransferase [Candidatus Eremiobacteraeota bacterium]|nr:GNAT family N-acetyltransferase [Candidatus Eremiobacteraeota bacterium]